MGQRPLSGLPASGKQSPGRAVGVRGRKGRAGETKRQALIRECREELDVTIAAGEVFLELPHSYPDLTIYLTVFHASIAEGTPRLLEHQAMRWVTAKEAETMSFCPADQEIIERLKRI